MLELYHNKVIIMIKKILFLPLVLLSFTLVTSLSYANSESRGFVEILSPHTKLPPGGVEMKPIQPLSREKITRLINEMFQAYNSLSFDNFLSDNFTDKQRLMDAISQLSRDAVLERISNDQPQTLTQFLVINKKTRTISIISDVAVNTRSRLRFDDPARGRQLLEGNHELIIRVTEKFTPKQG